MMTSRSLPIPRLRPAALLLTLALAAGLVGTAPAAAQDPPELPGECAPIMPVADVEPGMVGTGLSVVQGTEPEPFSAEVLTVLEGGISPDTPMIVIRASSPTVDEAGIWFGMSGSPIYVDGQLIGAVAYGTFSDSPIAGVTPAESMARVLDYGADDVDPDGAEQLQIPLEERERLARDTGLTLQQLSEPLQRLKLPAAVLPAMSAERMAQIAADERFQRLAELLDHPGLVDTRDLLDGREAPPTGLLQEPSPADVVPGGNFAAALSYGDAQFYGVGTTTYVCDDVALAFGHPFFFEGEVTLGANLADALVVPEGVFPGFKLASLFRQPVGTVDQDRLTAVRAQLGLLPDEVPVTSTLEFRDDPQRSRTGTTDVVFDEFLADLVLSHLFINFDLLVHDDFFFPGSSEMQWTVTGTRADGSPWQLTRQNRYANDFDLSSASIFELYVQLLVLQENNLEPIEFTAVDVEGSTGSPFEQYRLDDLVVLVDGEPAEAPFFVEAEPGDTIDVQVALRPFTPFRQPDVDVAELSLEVPEGFFEGQLEITGGGAFADPFECLFNPEACVPEADPTIDGLIEALEGMPRNDEIVATLRAFPEFGEPVPVPEPPVDEPVEDEPAVDPAQVEPLPPGIANGFPPDFGDILAEDRAMVDLVVEPFFHSLSVLPPGPPEPELLRLSGPDRIGTAIALSQESFPETSTAVVLARADQYPDALAGAPLARMLEAPILLTESETLTARVADEVERLGADTAVLLGGTAALSEQVADGVAALGLDVERVSGVTRFETAAEIAAQVGGTQVYLAQGIDPNPARGWPDALSVSALAALEGSPILLTQQDALPEATRQAMADLEATAATVVGGTVAVSEDVAAEVAAEGLSVDRVSGATRYDTSLAVAERALASGANPARTWLATGRAFPDALAAGPAAAADGGVLLLVDGQGLAGSPAAQMWIDMLAGVAERVVLVGGTQAITPEVEAEIFERLLGVVEPEPVG